MADTNYVSGIAKILETPRQQKQQNDILTTKFRAQIPQLRSLKTITVTCWGNLAQDIINYYKVNDYLILEGYLSIRKEKLESKIQLIELTVLKVYPYFCYSN